MIIKKKKITLERMNRFITGFLYNPNYEYDLSWRNDKIRELNRYIIYINLYSSQLYLKYSGDGISGPIAF